MFSHLSHPLALTLLLLAAVVQGHNVVELGARANQNSSDDRAPKLGAVASESAVCSYIGTELLEKGGNAADAVRYLLTLLLKGDGKADLVSSWLEHRFALVSSVTLSRVASYNDG